MDAVGESAVTARVTVLTLPPHPDVIPTTPENPIPRPRFPRMLVSDVHLTPSVALPIPARIRSVMSTDPSPRPPTTVTLVDPVPGPFTRTMLLACGSVKSCVTLCVNVSRLPPHSPVIPISTPRKLPTPGLHRMLDADIHVVASQLLRPNRP